MNKDISNLMASPSKKRDDFFGFDIETKDVAKNIENIKNERAKKEKTEEITLNVEQNPENGQDVVKIKSNLDANIQFLDVKATERRLVTIEQDVVDSLDAIEKAVADAYRNKYGKDMKTRVKSEILNKILKSGLKASLGIEVE